MKTTEPKRYEYREFPLERAGVALHLDRMCLAGERPQRSILLTHGVTYSSREFDIDYLDYSLVRFLAREGYAVWRLDIAGYGRSGAVEDGFLPDSDYAAEDVCAAVERIVRESGEETIDLLGWSWGTVTAGRCAARHPEHVRRLVLYAPILTGIGREKIDEPFHHNTWEHASDDFQKTADGRFDLDAAERAVIELYCSSCLHGDGERSPNGGRRDICVERERDLIPLEDIEAPTLVICGDRDPYLNYDRLRSLPERLPACSALRVIPGGAHMLMIEKPYYHRFREELLRFLKAEEAD